MQITSVSPPSNWEIQSLLQKKGTRKLLARTKFSFPDAELEGARHECSLTRETESRVCTKARWRLGIAAPTHSVTDKSHQKLFLLTTEASVWWRIPLHTPRQPPLVDWGHKGYCGLEQEAWSPPLPVKGKRNETAGTEGWLPVGSAQGEGYGNKNQNRSFCPWFMSPWCVRHPFK